MATVAVAQELASAEARAALPLGRVLADIGLVAGRNLRKVLRNTRLIVFSTVQPVMQLVLFAYVFSAVASLGNGINYKDFVVPAVLVQAMTFSAMGSGVGIANDLQTGMIDRFRSLPIARSAFLVGRTVSDSLRLGIQALLLVVAATLIGFRFHAGPANAIAMVLVVVLFGIALTSFSAWMGLTVGDPETVQAAVFIPILPLVFTSSAFAPVSPCPGGCNPSRATVRSRPPSTRRGGFALGDSRLHSISHVHLTTSALHFLVWWIAIVGTFTALAVRKYRLG